MKIKMRLSIGYPTATHKDEIKLDDDMTDEEIDKCVRDWAENYIEITWDKVEE